MADHRADGDENLDQGSEAETADDRAYATRLGDVLRQRSVPALRAFLEAQASRYGDERQVQAIRAQSDAEIEMVLHRMTLARADLESLHAESARWLASHGVPPGAPARERPTPRPGGRSGRSARRPGRRPPARE